MNYFWALICLLSIVACSEQRTKDELPYLGRHEIFQDSADAEGEPVVKKHFKIPDFELYNQYGDQMKRTDVEGKVYVADFFFTSCPDPCPTMKEKMKIVYDRFKGRDDFLLLSHSVDPEYDTVEVLYEFAEKLNANNDNWYFLTGPTEKIYTLAEDGYMANAMVDEEAPGGVLHSSFFILIDDEGHIRGIYDGVNQEQVEALMADIELLLE